MAFNPLSVSLLDCSAFEAAFAAAGGRVAVREVTSTPEVLAAVDEARTGVRVVLVAGPAAWPALAELGLTVEPLPVPTSADDPLVAVSSVWAEGTGPAVGQRLELQDPGAISGGRPLAVWADRVVAVRLDDSLDGAGACAVVAGRLPEGAALGSSLGWFLQVADVAGDGWGPASVAAARAVFGLAGRPHPPVPVVTADEWDLSLLPAEVSSVNDPELMVAAGRAGRLLPAAVHDALVGFADGSNASGALLVRGVPTGVVPATPESPLLARKPDMVSEFALLTVARRLGQPVGFAPEHGGDLVQNVSPTRAGATRQVSTSSKTVLEFHTEAAFHPMRPRFLMLLCLRGDPLASTTLCSVSALLPNLSVEEREVLSQPRFTTGIDESYTGVRSAARSLPRPVLWGTPSRPRLFLDADLMVGVDSVAQEALDRIAELARTRGTGVVLEPGDLLVVDNDVAVHGRSPFVPRFDGTDRWLQRSMVVPDLAAAGSALVGRIVATQFGRV